MRNRKHLSLIFSLGIFGLALVSCGGTTGGTSTTSQAINRVLTRIEISKPAEKLTYMLHESLDTTGLEVRASWSTGRGSVVDNKDLVFTGFDSETAGKKTINIAYTYENVTKNASYTVTVKDDQATTVELDFYTMNDWHGNVLDSDLGAGIAKTAAFLKQKSADKNSIFISSGDMWQGSLESNSTRGALMTEWMESLNFAAMTIGNHEFDWGTKCIKDNMENYNVPILGINIIDRNTRQRPDYVKPSAVVERGGAKIGIIGAIGDCYGSISYSQVMDVEFLLDSSYGGHDLSDLVKAESTRLRQEEGCDFIVFSIHGDTLHNDTYYNVELSSEGYVDVVLEGHKHVQTHYVDNGGVHHFQCEADSRLNINHFSVELDTKSDSYEITFNDGADVYSMNDRSVYLLDEDPATLSIINKYDFSEYYKSLGYNSRARWRNELRQLCADLYLEAAQKKWADLAGEMVLAGGYISVRGTGELPVGSVSYAMLYTLFPFDNDILLARISGYALKVVYFQTTNTNYFMAYTPGGYTLRDTPSLVNDSDLYYVVMDTYTYDWMVKTGYNPTKVASYDEHGYFARDLLAEYAKAGRFNEGGVLNPVDITHAGTLESPFSVAEAYTMQVYQQGGAYFIKGKVSDATTPFISGNHFYGITLVDNDNAAYSLKINCLHKFDDDSIFGFQDASELPIGTEIVVYGVLASYSAIPILSDNTMAITKNGIPFAGDAFDNPISVQNYNLLGQNDAFVFGRITNYQIEGESLSFLLLEGASTINFPLPQGYSYGLSFFNDAYDIRWNESIDMNSVGINSLAIISIIGNKVTILGAEESPIEDSSQGDIPSIQHAGTYDDPYTVKDALIAARDHIGGNADEAEAPTVYCRGVVSRESTKALGRNGDIGSVYVRDLDGFDEIQIYYISRYQGATLEDNFQSPTDLAHGDVILFVGRPFYYQESILEFSSGAYCVTINGVEQGPSGQQESSTPIEEQSSSEQQQSSESGPSVQHAGTYDDPYTVADALIEAKSHIGANAVNAGAPSVYCRAIVSRASSKPLGNSGDIGSIYVKDEGEDNEILIYYISRFEGATSENNFKDASDLQVGDEILFVGRPFNYNGTTLEFSYGAYCVTINGVTQTAEQGQTSEQSSEETTASIPMIQHAGTLEDPYTVADAILEAQKHVGAKVGDTDAIDVYCKGTVSRKAASRSTRDGSLNAVYINDGEGTEEIMIYYLAKFYGATLDTNFGDEDALEVGDEIVIYGRPFNYNGSTLEFASGTYCITINGTPTN